MGDEAYATKIALLTPGYVFSIFFLRVYKTVAILNRAINGPLSGFVITCNTKDATTYQVRHHGATT